MTRTPLLTAIVVVAALALAFALNPSPERHRETLKEAIAQRSPVAGALGLGALTAFVSNYHTVGVASYTTVNGRTASIGAFGMVFVLSTEPQS